MVRLSAKQASLNMISTMISQAKISFMIYRDISNALRLLKFFNQLIKMENKKNFPTFDNSVVYHSRLGKKWLTKKSYTENCSLPSPKKIRGISNKAI